MHMHGNACATTGTAQQCRRCATQTRAREYEQKPEPSEPPSTTPRRCICTRRRRRRRRRRRHWQKQSRYRRGPCGLEFASDSRLCLSLKQLMSKMTPHHTSPHSIAEPSHREREIFNLRRGQKVIYTSTRWPVPNRTCQRFFCFLFFYFDRGFASLLLGPPHRFDALTDSRPHCKLQQPSCRQHRHLPMGCDRPWMYPGTISVNAPVKCTTVPDFGTVPGTVQYSTAAALQAQRVLSKHGAWMWPDLGGCVSMQTAHRIAWDL